MIRICKRLIQSGVLFKMNEEMKELEKDNSEYMINEWEGQQMYKPV